MRSSPTGAYPLRPQEGHWNQISGQRWNPAGAVLLGVTLEY